MAKIINFHPFIHSRHRGFSLVELLTVIAVISVLAMILVPVVRSVQDNSRTAICTSNLRSLGLAIRLFSQEAGGPAQIHQGYDANGDRLGPGGAYFTRLVTGGYVDRGADVFYSPNNAYPRQYGWQTNRDLGISGVSYGWNLNVHDGYESNLETYSFNSTELAKFPILMTMDTSPSANSGGASVGYSLRGRVGYLYKDRANVLFPAGHVEQKERAYFNERRNWSPQSTPPWN